MLATTLDVVLNPVTVNQAILTPQHNTTLTPRLDQAIERAQPDGAQSVQPESQPEPGRRRFQPGVEGVRCEFGGERAAGDGDCGGESAIPERGAVPVAARGIEPAAAAATAAAITVQGAFAGGGRPSGQQRAVSPRGGKFGNTSSWVRGAAYVQMGRPRTACVARIDQRFELRRHVHLSGR